ncbi:MAG: hypothetical protein ACI8Y4_004279 [Candidatus Poriferisodalaceae bacterium]
MTERRLRRLASASIIAMLTASMFRFKAVGIDPPIPMPALLTEILDEGRSQGRYSSGILPFRIAALLPMGFGLLLIRPRGLVGLLKARPLRSIMFVLVWALLVVPTALRPGLSLFGTLTLCGSLLFVVWYTREFGIEALLRTLVGFVAGLSLMSLVWFAVTGDGFDYRRFTGVSLAPSHFGEATGLAFVALVAFRGRLFSTPTEWALVATIGVTVILTGTRSAAGGVLVALAFLALGRRRLLPYFFAASLAVTPFVMFSGLVNPALEIISRSESDGVSLSDRTVLWETVVDDADQLIWTGAGYGNGAGGQSDYLLQKSRDGVFERALVYGHNYLVGSFLSLGLVGLLLVLVIPIAYSRAALSLSDPRADAIVVYLFATGIAENVLLESPIRVSSMTLVALFTYRATQLQERSGPQMGNEVVRSQGVGGESSELANP